MARRGSRPFATPIHRGGRPLCAQGTGQRNRTCPPTHYVLHWIVSQYITLNYIKVYITLHYITLHHVNISRHLLDDPATLLAVAPAALGEGRGRGGGVTCFPTTVKNSSRVGMVDIYINTRLRHPTTPAALDDRDQSFAVTRRAPLFGLNVARAVFLAVTPGVLPPSRLGCVCFCLDVPRAIVAQALSRTARRDDEGGAPRRRRQESRSDGVF